MSMQTQQETTKRNNIVKQPPLWLIRAVTISILLAFIAVPVALSIAVFTLPALTLIGVGFAGVFIGALVAAVASIIVNKIYENKTAIKFDHESQIRTPDNIPREGEKFVFFNLKELQGAINLHQKGAPQKSEIEISRKSKEKYGVKLGKKIKYLTSDDILNYDDALAKRTTVFMLKDEYSSKIDELKKLILLKKEYKDDNQERKEAVDIVTKHKNQKKQKIKNKIN